MDLPVGMLIYWVTRLENDKASILGMWYYKELYVPSSIDDKKNSIVDLKNKRCTVLCIDGKYEQIKEILTMTDIFIDASQNDINLFNSLLSGFENSSKSNPFFFDDINNCKGTALSLDSSIGVHESMDTISLLINNGYLVNVNLLENWSFQDDFIKFLEG